MTNGNPHGMSCLLDTHAFLWLVFDDSRLSEAARSVIREPSNTVYVSAVTFWEISIKYALGKLILENCTPERLAGLVETLNLEALELTPAEAAGFYRLPKMRHKDPFDRMILWQAIQRGLVLISKDKQVAGYHKLGLKTLW